MRNRLRTLAACLLLSAMTPAAWAGEPPSIADYGELPDVEDAALSPSGSYIAMLATMDGQRVLMILGRDMTVHRRMAVGALKIRSFDWIDDARVLLVTSQTQSLGFGFTTDKHEFHTATIVPTSKDSEPHIIFSDDRRVPDAIFGQYGIRKRDGKLSGYFGALEFRRNHRNDYEFDHGRPHLYRVDFETNDARQVGPAGPEGTDRDWIVGADGEIAARFEINTRSGEWEIRGTGGKVIRTGTSPSGRTSLIGLNYDGTSLLYSDRDADNVAQWYELPLAGGAAKPFLADADVERLFWDDETGYLRGYLDAEEGPVFLDPAHQDAARKIRRAFAKYDMRMVDWTGDFDAAIVRTSGNENSGTWFFVDLASLRAEGFAWERPRIAPEQVGPISTFAYTAADGLEMDGILTLPPGREPKNLPVLMMPHGGPHGADSEQFDWWAQAYAARGYAVFQPNFRGSTNRTQAFKLAGYGEWGRKMQTDISDGLAALAKEGIVDPERACIVGASYGGYAALAGVTLQQGLYRCAVAVAPVSDIKAMYNEDYRGSGSQRITKAALLQQLGPRDRWDDVSPRRFARQADAPVLLIHGRDDTVVPYSHSHKMANALKDAGKSYELVTLAGEDHWLSLSETRRQMLESAVAFVEKHNPPD
ncbi:S9 family peptidase [Qipengyuania sp. JC766]|uniref:alpha/beta hydrolase family protein n=1 Tax=Qipengyuania sp. JC766 TaxID=3232139 RepID=UPI003459651E